MSIDELKKLDEMVKDQVQRFFEPEPWPEIGTKAWFQRYVQSIVDYDNDKPRMSQEKLDETFQSLNKFDPTFADLCKKAHDTAIDLMDYAQKRMENK